jgi:hypothetical protein
MLPWFEEIFYKNGSRLDNFYTRGISLSGPAWGMIDTGQHMQVKGNVEFDRFTLQTYDYLRFFAFYLDNYLKKRADMPAAEVMDQLNIPLLVDMFPFEKRYHSGQLYQRDNHWMGNLGAGFVGLFPRDRTDLLNEYSMGFEFLSMTVRQNEREIAERVITWPQIDYFDYFDPGFDHVLHDNNDEESRLIELKKIDLTLGRFWTGIQGSSRKDETALILVSDHGFNGEKGVFSQGFNLVTMLTDASGGGHHVMTKRRILLDYAGQGGQSARARDPNTFEKFLLSKRQAELLRDSPRRFRRQRAFIDPLTGKRAERDAYPAPAASAKRSFLGFAKMPRPICSSKKLMTIAPTGGNRRTAWRKNWLRFSVGSMQKRRRRRPFKEVFEVRPGTGSGQGSS